MEGYILKWLNIISGFKPRYAVIKDGKLELTSSKEEPGKKIYDLANSKIVEDKKLNHFSIEINSKKISFKTYSEYERTQWIKAFQQHQIISAKQIESNSIEKKFDIEIDTDKDLHKVMCDCLYNIQNNVFELNLSINAFHQYIQTKSKKDVCLLAIYEQLLSIKQHLRLNVDETIKTVVEFNSKHCVCKKKSIAKKSDMFYEASEYNLTKDSMYQTNQICGVGTEDIIENKKEDESEESSFEDCDDLANTEINFGDIEHRNLEKKISLKKGDMLFDFSSYKFPVRTKLPSVLKSSNSMISDMVKAAMKERGSLPVTYNEPLSMLQRQIESFQFYDLLQGIYNEKEVPIKYAYIMGFLTAEISLNINRLLKPFNPILGETYEYVEIDKYRVFCEQVSHHPPISAFLLESKNLTVYGDSKNKHKFQFMKGAVEMNFSSKTHILVHEDKEEGLISGKTSHHFVFGKPTYYFKGLLYGTPRYDFVGEVRIDDIIEEKDDQKDSYYGIIEFLDESKIKLGEVQGKIFKGKDIIYTVKGNWKSGLTLYDKLNTKIKDIWTISNEEFITNKDPTSNYMISNFAKNLNFLPEELIKFLPCSDSRLRPDQREFELGNIEQAEELKKKLEQKQRDHAKSMETLKQVYKPMYFDLAGSEQGQFYVPSKDYWKDRISGNFEHINDIFNIKEY